MPWMPEVFTAAPIAEVRLAQGATSTNDAVPYYEGIMAEEPDALVRSFARQQPVLDDPRLGHVEGAEPFTAFVADQAAWLRERDTVVENVALTLTPLRTVEEVVVHMLADDGVRVELPVAVVSERNPDRTLKAVRVYHSLWPLTGEHRVRPPLLPEDPNLHAEGAPGDYQRALAEGDLAGIVATFEPDGYAREPSGGAYLHRGAEGLREVYVHMFANGGGIPLEHCTLTDDGVRCAIDYNCVRWGLTGIPPQVGVAVYERGSSGLLSAARIYDDVEPPAVSNTSVG
jgi:SnoaL-like domain